MSNGARAARKLRVKPSPEAAALLAADEAAFQQKFKSFRSRIVAHKTSHAMQTHQMVWRQECMQLNKARKQAETELESIYNALLPEPHVGAKTPMDAMDAEFRSLIRAARHEAESERRTTLECKQRLQAVRRQAKQLLQQHKRSMQEQRKLQGNSGKEKQAEISSAAASSPFAIFLQDLRTHLSLQRQQLETDANTLVQELSQMRSWIDGAVTDDAVAAPTPEAPTTTESAAVSPVHDAVAAVEPAEHEEKEPEESGRTAASDADGSGSSHRPFLASTTLSPRHVGRTAHTQRGLPPSPATWPPLPPLDPSFIARLSSDYLTAQSEAREYRWEESRREWERINARFEGVLEDLRELHHSETEALRERIRTSDAAVGWSHEHEARFKHVLNSYRRQGKKHGQLMERLRLEFPVGASATAAGSDPFCLIDRVELHDKQRSYKAQRQSLLNVWENERAAHQQRSLHQLLTADAASIEAWERAEARKEQTAQQEALHAELEVLREEKAAREREEAAVRAAQQQKQAEEDAVREARHAALREKQRQLLQLYHDHMAAEEAEARRIAETERAATVAAQRHELELAKPRLQRRQELLQAKREALAAKEAAKHEAAEAREARLEAIRHLVATTAERDPQRLLAPTASSAAESQSAGQHPLFAVHGYDMSELLKDKRFRIQLALWNVGLHNTDYARQIIQTAPAATLPRRDMQSNVFPARPM